MKKTIKIILCICLVLLTCVLIFTACDSENDTESKAPTTDAPVTDSPTTSLKPINSDTTASTEPNTPSDTESNTTDPSKTQPLIPTDPEELVRILTAMGFEPEIEKIESDEDAQNCADIFGVSTDAVEGLVFVTFYIPSEDFGPSDFMNFFYCTNVKRTLEIKAILDTESGYVIEQEGNIIAYGTEYLWEAFIDFNSN